MTPAIEKQTADPFTGGKAPAGVIGASGGCSAGASPVAFYVDDLDVAVEGQRVRCPYRWAAPVVRVCSPVAASGISPPDEMAAGRRRSAASTRLNFFSASAARSSQGRGRAASGERPASGGDVVDDQVGGAPTGAGGLWFHNRGLRPGPSARRGGNDEVQVGGCALSAGCAVRCWCGW